MFDNIDVPYCDTTPHSSPAAEHRRLGKFVHIKECAGFFHPGPASEGIIILPPFGQESLACVKTLRLLAERLSMLGYPTLRLDFPGTGDSLGDESSIDVFQSRTTAAAEAARWMRDIAGVQEVSVIGVRLGASIALMAAGNMGLKRLLLAGPILSGRTYLRELKQLQRFYASEPVTEQSIAPNEFTGFFVSEASLEGLKALDLRGVEAPADVATAIISPANGSAASLAQKWQSAGTGSTLIEYDAIANLINDPTTEPPDEKFCALALDWFGPSENLNTDFWSPECDSSIETEHFVEEGCRFGEERTAFGILCKPKEPQAQMPALIIVNTGGNSHIGWGRQTVEVARSLAREGITTFRMDVNGVGETPDLPGRSLRLVYVEESALEVIAAVEFLKFRGYRRPALSGNCSGAYLVFHAARMGADISGVQMLNLQKFYWREGDSLILLKSTDSYFCQLFQIDVWKRLLGGQVDFFGLAFALAKRLARKATLRISALSGEVFNTGTVGPAQSDQAAPGHVLSLLCERGIHVNMAYTKSDGGIDEMVGQLGSRGRMVRGNGNFTFGMLNVVDHNFSTLGGRNLLLASLAGFVRSVSTASIVRRERVISVWAEPEMVPTPGTIASASMVNFPT